MRTYTHQNAIIDKIYANKMSMDWGQSGVHAPRPAGSDRESAKQPQMSHTVRSQLRVQHLGDGIDLNDFVLPP